MRRKAGKGGGGFQEVGGERKNIKRIIMRLAIFKLAIASPWFNLRANVGWGAWCQVLVQVFSIFLLAETLREWPEIVSLCVFLCYQ